MIALGSDHGGYALKQHVMAYLTEKGIPYRDFGCDSTDSCDYPDFGSAAARAVADGTSSSVPPASVSPSPPTR